MQVSQPVKRTKQRWTHKKTFFFLLYMVDEALAVAVAAQRRGDSATCSSALARALRAALATRIPGALALASEELRDRSAGDADTSAAVEMLARLDRARFEPEAAAPELAAARACVDALRRGPL